MKYKPLLVLAAGLLLILTISAGLYAEMPASRGQGDESVREIPGLSWLLPGVCAGTGSPGAWIGLSGDRPGPLVCTSGEIRREGNTIIMKDCTFVIPDTEVENIGAEGITDGPGFGKIYIKGGTRTVSGRITIEPLPQTQ
jgi:hypothetical protein